MWNVPVTVDGLAREVNYPSICPLSPEKGKAFCKKHCEDACKGNIPTGLREFLRHCGITGTGTYHWHCLHNNLMCTAQAISFSYYRLIYFTDLFFKMYQ